MQNITSPWHIHFYYCNYPSPAVIFHTGGFVAMPPKAKEIEIGAIYETSGGKRPGHRVVTKQIYADVLGNQRVICEAVDTGRETHPKLTSFRKNYKRIAPAPPPAPPRSERLEALRKELIDLTTALQLTQEQLAEVRQAVRDLVA